MNGSDEIRSGGAAVLKELDGIAAEPGLTTNSAVPAPESSIATCWVPSDQSARVGCIDIGGMVYLMNPGREDLPAADAHGSVIDASLPVAANAPADTARFYTYDPTYETLTASERRVYLRWLASGRSDPNIETPCVRLYFLGLERRTLLDDPDPAERAELFAEAERLLNIYGDDENIAEELVRFLDLAPIFDALAYVPNPKELAERNWKEMPLPLTVSLGRKLADDQVIDGRWLFSWWLTSSLTKVRAVHREFVDELATLFSIRLATAFPKGYTVRSPGRRLQVEYCSASNEYRRDLCSELTWCPDVSRLTRPPKLADRLVAECMSDLGPYIRFVQRRPRESETVAAQMLLPADLAESRQNNGLQTLDAWVSECIRERDGEALVDELMRLFDGERPSSIRQQRLERVTRALKGMGVGLAPHPRWTYIALKLGDPIVLYRDSDIVGRWRNASPRYESLLTALRCGAYVAQADGRVSSGEQRALEAMVEHSKWVNPEDLPRLRADVRWVVRKQQSLLALRRRCERYPTVYLLAILELAVAVALADGLADPAAVEAVQKLYRATGMPEDEVFASLHRMAAEAATQDVAEFRPQCAPPSRGAKGEGETGEGPESAEEILDAGRISRIVEDTQKVSRVLSEVFSEDGASADGQDAKPAEAPEAPVGCEGLDEAHCALVRKLLERPSWSESEFSKLASGFGLMPGGALESVNEWSFRTLRRCPTSGRPGTHDQRRSAPSVAERINGHLECRSVVSGVASATSSSRPCELGWSPGSGCSTFRSAGPVRSGKWSGMSSASRTLARQSAS